MSVYQMSKVYKCITPVIFMFSVVICGQVQAQITFSRSKSFDAGWRFTRDSVTDAEKPTFDDSKWRLLDLPHDWSIEDIRNQKPGIAIGPFSKASVGDMSTGHTVGGTGWYRKTFTLG